MGEEGLTMKLVRDKIPELYPHYGYRRATPDETTLLLRLKLAEETGEALSAPDPESLAKELADVLEVVYEIADQHGVSLHELEILRRAKADAHGRFSEGWVLL
jgi:predicted house-cleaning noncanonical NTP pyrophosphatase (MazG superfamily)